MEQPKILLVGDSFGTERKHNTEVEVPLQDTWPKQVQEKTIGMKVDIDFKPFRRIVECVDLIETDANYDLVIIQAGIVDCFPRPFPLNFSKSMKLINRIVRRIVRPVRREWINYVYRTRWSSENEIISAIQTINKRVFPNKVGYITVAPLLNRDAQLTPGAQESIFDFNDLLRELSKSSPNMFIIDLHTELLSAGFKKYLSSYDSHLNKEGNFFLRDIVLQKIESWKKGEKYH